MLTRKNVRYVIRRRRTYRILSFITNDHIHEKRLDISQARWIKVRRKDLRHGRYLAMSSSSQSESEDEFPRWLNSDNDHAEEDDLPIAHVHRMRQAEENNDVDDINMVDMLEVQIDEADEEHELDFTSTPPLPL